VTVSQGREPRPREVRKVRSAQRRKMHWNESCERSMCVCVCVCVRRTIDWPKVTSSAPEPSRLAPNSENATALWRPVATRDPVDMPPPEARRTTGLPHLRARVCVCVRACRRHPRPARLLKPQPRRRASTAPAGWTTCSQRQPEGGPAGTARPQGCVRTHPRQLVAQAAERLSRVSDCAGSFPRRLVFRF
jgi:hypothetical protein